MHGTLNRIRLCHRVTKDALTQVSEFEFYSISSVKSMKIFEQESGTYNRDFAVLIS